MLFRRFRREAADSTGGPEPAAPSAPASESGPEPDPLERRVAEYRRKAEAADKIRGVNTDNLADHRANPNVVEHAEASRDALHRELITWEDDRTRLCEQHEHTRLKAKIEAEQRWADAEADRDTRSITQAQADADAAAEQLRAIHQAQRDYDPAEAASQMARSRSRYMNLFLRFAWAASALSAVGLGVLVNAKTSTLVGAVAAGLLGEVVMTVLVTVIIASQAELDRRSGLARDGQGTIIAPRPTAWAERLPWAGVAGLLSVSIVANLYGALTGTGVFGVLGAVGAGAAALCSFLAWGYSVQASAVIVANLADQGIGAGLKAVQQRASGAHIPHRSVSPAEGQPEVSDPGSDQLQALLDAIASRQLAETPVPDNPAGLAKEGPGDDVEDADGGGTRLLPRPSEGGGIGETGAEQHQHRPTGEVPAQGGETGRTGAEQHEHADEESEGDSQGGGIGETGAEQRELAPHHQARIQQGQHTRERILKAMSKNPGGGPRVIANATGIKYETVRGHIKALKNQGRL